MVMGSIHQLENVQRKRATTLKTYRILKDYTEPQPTQFILLAKLI